MSHREGSADYADYADYADSSSPSAKSADNKARDPQTYAIIGAAMTVHRSLGHGFLEAVYQEALAIEMAHVGIPFDREVDLPIRYRNTLLACHYRADFICYDAVIVELKALSQISNAEKAQVLNYLKATGLERGLLFNFGTPSIRYERFIHSTQSAPSAKSADNHQPWADA